MRVLISLILMFSGVAHADFKTADSSCASSPGDPYEPSLRFTKGVNQGKCFNTGEMRSIQLIPNFPNAVPGKIYFANFQHDHKFWIAALDPSDIQDISEVTENFPSPIPAAHTMLRFKMKPGKSIDLIDQSTAVNPAHTQISDFMSSVEAVTGRPNGKPYNVAAGAVDGNYGLAYRMISTKDKYDWVVAEAHHKTDQVRLNLTDAEKESVLMSALQLSDKSAMNHSYNTLTRSCTTELFKALDRGIHRPGVATHLKVHAFKMVAGQMYPIFAKEDLKVRGLLTGDYQEPSMDEDASILDEVRADSGSQPAATEQKNKPNDPVVPADGVPPTPRSKSGQ